MRKLLLLAIAALLAAPVAGLAHDPVTVQRCADDVVPGASHDCVRIDSDTEFEDGAEVGIDGDDESDRGDGYSDGYVHVRVSRDGEVTVSCEDEGGYNYASHREGGDEDDHNGDNDECGL